MKKELLVKLLNLTNSSNDSEALSAIRKANEFLKNHNTTWDKALSVTPVSEKNTYYEPAKKTVKETVSSEDIPALLRECLKSAKGELISSLSEQYEKKGYLTIKQYEALKKYHRLFTGEGE